MGRKKIYTNEELKERQKLYDKKYKINNLEKRKESLRKAQEKWRRKHGIVERNSKYVKNNTNLPYNKTPKGRAIYLLNRYKSSDKEHNRGESDLTAQWIVDNIFTKSCVHCGETDWTKIGCNRLDNSKPHTIDNVEPCCGKCNRKIK